MRGGKGIGMNPGELIWVTGLSGSGKTSLAVEIVRKWRKVREPVVLLDGDHLREVFGGRNGYSRSERLELGLAYGRLCKMLCDQGLHVVCATISLFRECQTWNRTHMSRYFEVYLDVPLSVLVERDPKGIYRKAMAGEVRNVMGVDVPFDAPERPDYTVTTTIRKGPAEWAKDIVTVVEKRARGERGGHVCR